MKKMEEKSDMLLFRVEVHVLQISRPFKLSPLKRLIR